MDLEKRIEVLEKKVAELEGQVQEQPSIEENIIMKSKIKKPFRILEAYDPDTK